MKNLEWKTYGLSFYDSCLKLRTNSLMTMIEMVRKNLAEIDKVPISNIAVIRAMHGFRNYIIRQGADERNPFLALIDNEICYREATEKPRWRA